jgi:hypothetical protein
MDLLRASEVSLQLHHQHEDGSWGVFEPVAAHHSPADHDPERDWANGTIYKCSACDEQVVVSPLGDPREERP